MDWVGLWFVETYISAFVRVRWKQLFDYCLPFNYKHGIHGVSYNLTFEVCNILVVSDLNRKIINQSLSNNCLAVLWFKQLKILILKKNELIKSTNFISHSTFVYNTKGLYLKKRLFLSTRNDCAWNRTDWYSYFYTYEVYNQTV